MMRGALVRARKLSEEEEEEPNALFNRDNEEDPKNGILILMSWQQGQGHQQSRQEIKKGGERARVFLGVTTSQTYLLGV